MLLISYTFSLVSLNTTVGVWYMLRWVGGTIAVGECYILGGCVIHVAVAVWQTAAPLEVSFKIL